MTTIEPLAPRPPEISVVEPVSSAYERMKEMLFKPFDLSRWFTIGFCAWLAMLGQAGSRFGGNYGGSHGNHSAADGQPGDHFRHVYHQTRDYVMENLYWILPLAVLLVLLGLAFWVLMTWLSSRGKFMFLHCVALNKAEVKVPWDQHAGTANSLFRFRIGLGLTSMVVMLPLAVFIALVILSMVKQGAANAPGVMLAVGLALLFLLLALALGIMQKFLEDFVVPIMFLRGKKCVAAWREFLPLLRAYFGQFTLYLLFQIVLAMLIGTLVLAVILLTCCIAGCLMLLPFVGTVLLLPVLVFKRAYPLYFLAQFGPQYNVFPPPSLPTTPSTISRETL